MDDDIIFAGFYGLMIVGVIVFLYLHRNFRGFPLEVAFGAVIIMIALSALIMHLTYIWRKRTRNVHF